MTEKYKTAKTSHKKKSSKSSGGVQIPLKYVHVPKSRLNTILIEMPCHSTHSLVKAYMCGCMPDTMKDMHDANPTHSALGAAVLHMIIEKIILLKNSKNKVVEMKWGLIDGHLHVALIMPPDNSSLSQGLNVVKKVVHKKTS